MIRFLRKLNTLACTLDMAAPDATIADVLWNLVEFLDKWNRQFFSKVTVQVDLLIMISRLSRGAVIDNHVQIPTTRYLFVYTEIKSYSRRLYWLD